MSQLEVDKIIPQSGTTLTIGDSGDTISLPSGVNLDTLTITGDLTVDTNTLYVDSTNNRVGVKNASPTVELDVTGEAKISGDLTVDTDTLYVDSTNNRVGVGTTSGNRALSISSGTGGSETIALEAISGAADANTATTFRLTNSTGFGSAAGAVELKSLRDGSGTGASFVISSSTASSTVVERCRIDSSGRLLVGKTDDSFSIEGMTIAPNFTNLTRDGNPPLGLNRLSSFGDIVGFYKDGSPVGSIGALGSDLTVGNDDAGLRFYNGINAITPFDLSTNSDKDNFLDLGTNVIRFDDIYATNGTIQTSDQNEKQSIQSLTASEIAVAKRISQGFKTYKWNSAVEEKGDNARTHTGIIAQEVQQAFSNEGLDASNYALFISSTWWEKEISVDAVAEELDEEGNVLVEGKDAYTYMDIKDEATEGYTQRTRLGIRYPELLSFVSSAFEQRLTNIETRLETLENE